MAGADSVAGAVSVPGADDSGATGALSVAGTDSVAGADDSEADSVAGVVSVNGQNVV